MDQLPGHGQADGVTLRRWTADDVAALQEAVLANVDHLRPRMPWAAGEPRTLDDRRELVAGWERDWAAGGDVVLGIWRDGAVVGSAGLHRRLGPEALEVGYWVDHRHLGRGIATTATRIATDLAFTVPGIEVVEVHHDVTNHASGRVPAKLGFRWVADVVGGPEPLGPADGGVERQWRTTRADWLGDAR